MLPSYLLLYVAFVLALFLNSTFHTFVALPRRRKSSYMSRTQCAGLIILPIVVLSLLVIGIITLPQSNVFIPKCSLTSVHHVLLSLIVSALYSFSRKMLMFWLKCLEILIIYHPLNSWAPALVIFSASVFITVDWVLIAVMPPQRNIGVAVIQFLGGLLYAIILGALIPNLIKSKRLITQSRLAVEVKDDRSHYKSTAIVLILILVLHTLSFLAMTGLHIYNYLKDWSNNDLAYVAVMVEFLMSFKVSAVANVTRFRFSARHYSIGDGVHTWFTAGGKPTIQAEVDQFCGTTVNKRQTTVK